MPTTSASSRGGLVRVSRPATVTRPDSVPPVKCGTSPLRQRSRVDLPEPGLADDQDELALGDVQLDAVQRRAVRPLVGDADVLEPDGAGHGCSPAVRGCPVRGSGGVQNAGPTAHQHREGGHEHQLGPRQRDGLHQQCGRRPQRAKSRRPAAPDTAVSHSGQRQGSGRYAVRGLRRPAARRPTERQEDPAGKQRPAQQPGGGRVEQAVEPDEHTREPGEDQAGLGAALALGDRPGAAVSAAVHGCCQLDGPFEAAVEHGAAGSGERRNAPLVVPAQASGRADPTGVGEQVRGERQRDDHGHPHLVEGGGHRAQQPARGSQGVRRTHARDHHGEPKALRRADQDRLPGDQAAEADPGHPVRQRDLGERERDVEAHRGAEEHLQQRAGHDHDHPQAQGRGERASPLRLRPPAETTTSQAAQDQSEEKRVGRSRWPRPAGRAPRPTTRAGAGCGAAVRSSRPLARGRVGSWWAGPWRRAYSADRAARRRLGIQNAAPMSRARTRAPNTNPAHELVPESAVAASSSVVLPAATNVGVGLLALRGCRGGGGVSVGDLDAALICGVTVDRADEAVVVGDCSGSGECLVAGGALGNGDARDNIRRAGSAPRARRR